jgi:hypothetical protein
MLLPSFHEAATSLALVTDLLLVTYPVSAPAFYRHSDISGETNEDRLLVYTKRVPGYG